MQSTAFPKLLLAAAAASLLSLPSTAASLITNGGFETGLAGWTLADQIGSDGSFSIQSGTGSPVNGIPVPAPSQGTFAAMTDAQGPGSHVLYQDIFIPVMPGTYTLSFQLFLGNLDTQFRTPGTLDFATTALNQQFRADLVSTGTDPFTVVPGEVLLNLYQTQVGDPTISGYLPVSVDVSAVLNANLGGTVRLRFAEVDNVNIFNAGVDNVALDDGTVPEPSTVSAALGLLAMAALKLRRR